jgi:hypothetical protein
VQPKFIIPQSAVSPEKNTMQEQKQEHVFLTLEQKMKVCKRSDLLAFFKVFLMQTAYSCIQISWSSHLLDNREFAVITNRSENKHSHSSHNDAKWLLLYCLHMS